jgi:hypothetical protein
MLKKAKAAKAAAVRKRRRIRQTLDRFVVIATNLSNAPRSTSGWTATLTRGTTTVTADFDDFGVARFPTINTLTTVSYVLRIRNADGELQNTSNVPADREVAVARF